MYFTLKETASVCGVVPDTVKKWIKAGVLVAYPMPASSHVRILADDLQQFISSNLDPISMEKFEAVASQKGR